MGVPTGLPDTAATAADIAAAVPPRQAALGSPVPAALADAAIDAARELTGSAASALVHTDLHGGNVLAGDREPWPATDPKPARGDPERSVPELLGTRADEVPDATGIRPLLAAVVDAGRLDADRHRTRPRPHATSPASAPGSCSPSGSPVRPRPGRQR